MEIWLDTSDRQSVEKASQLGILHGITTNPSIAARSGMALEDLLQSLLQAQKGPVAAQVMSAHAEEMVKQGEALFDLSNRLLIKIPVTSEGLQATYILSKKKIPVMATAVFDPTQTLLAARAGASYIAPYYSRICEEDMEGIGVFREMVHLLKRYCYSSKMIAASLRTTEQVRECSEIGVDAVTLNEKVFNEYIADHPMTLQMMRRFDQDWKSAAVSKVLPF